MRPLRKLYYMKRIKNVQRWSDVNLKSLYTMIETHFLFIPELHASPTVLVGARHSVPQRRPTLQLSSPKLLLRSVQKSTTLHNNTSVAQHFYMCGPTMFLAHRIVHTSCAGGTSPLIQPALDHLTILMALHWAHFSMSHRMLHRSCPGIPQTRHNCEWSQVLNEEK